MEKKHLSQALASVTALSLVMGQVPVQAIAEVVSDQGEAAVAQAQEAPADGNEPGDASENVDEDAAADASAGKKDEGATTAADDDAEAPAAGDAEAQPSNEAPAQDEDSDAAAYGIATYASNSKRFHGGEWTNAELYTYLTLNYAKSITTGFRLVKDGTSTEISVTNTDPVSLKSGTYTVEYKNLRGKWASNGTLTLQRYWEASVTTSGAEGGAIVVDGSDVTGTYEIDEGATKTFKPKEVADYKVSSVKINGVEATAGADGSYAIPSDADSTIAVEYVADNSAVVTVKGDNLKSVTVGGSALGQGGQVAVNAKTPGTVVATPADGYAVTGITFDGQPLSVTYANCTATATLPDGLAKDSNHDVVVETVKSGLVAKGATVDAGIAGKSANDYAGIVFDAAVDADASVPAGLTSADVKIEYGYEYKLPFIGTISGWKAIDSDFGAKGEGSTEKVRISFPGNDQYPASSIELTVNIVDGRASCHLSMNSATSIQYRGGDDGLDEMKASVYNQLAPTVVDDATNKPVTGLTADDFEFEGLEQKAGEQTVTVRFKGNDSYKDCEATATVTVTKAPSSVSVSNKSISYGDTVTIGDLVSSTPSNEETQPITVIAGIDGDGKGYLSIDLGYLGGGAIQDALNKYLHLDQGVTLNGLLDILNDDATMSTLKFVLQLAGMDSASADQLVDGLRTVLGQMQSMGLGDSTVALGGTPTKAGVYAVGAVTSSGNYETSVALGYLTIAPQTKNVELRWNTQLPQGGLAYGDAATFDFSSVAYQGDAPVAANVRTVFAGMTYAGKAYASSEPPTEPGAYTQTSYILGGNYYANPITRPFTINRMDSTIYMGGGYFEYDGSAQSQVAKVVGEDGETIENAKVTYLYTGLTAAGKAYAAFDEAPTEAGDYHVTATFLGNGKYGASSSTQDLVINPRDVEITVGDASKVYGQADPDFTYEVTDAGETAWLGSESVEDAVDATVSLSRAAGEEVGDYEIGATASTANKNFNLSVKPGKLTIQAGLAVEVDGHGNAWADAQVPGGPAGTQIQVSAEPESDAYVFSGWTVKSGDATVADPTAAQTTVTMGSANATVVAHFALKWTPITPTVKVTVEATEGGQATSNPHGAVPGTTVTITATPDEGYEFKGWKVISGGVDLADASALQTTFVLGEDAPVIQAVFARKPIAVNVSATEGGKAEADLATALPGQTVTVTATADAGYEFDGWEVLSGDVELADEKASVTTFVMGESEPSVRARFKKVAAPTPSEPKQDANTTDGKKDDGAAKAASDKKDKLAQTGDQSVNAAPIAIGGAAAVAAGAVLLRKRRREE